MKEKNFNLTTEYIELIHLLKLLRIAATGGHAKIIVEQNEVKVNGNPETRKRAKLRSGDVVSVMGWKVTIR